MNVRVKKAVPFGHRQVLRPSVANERVKELEQRDNGGSDADAGVSRWSVMPLHLRADRSSMHRAQRRQSEYLIPGGVECKRDDGNEEQGIRYIIVQCAYALTVM